MQIAAHLSSLMSFKGRHSLLWKIALVCLVAFAIGCGSVREVAEQSNRANDVLVSAAREGNLRRVKALLDEGVSPDAMTLDGEKAVNSAIMGRHWDVVKLLVERGAHNADKGDDLNYNESTVGMLEEAGKHDLAEIVRKRGNL